MMVSKIAVIALVAIVACPILLGYAMNLTETTESDYRGSGDSVNVTPLLQEGTEYNYAQADINEMNSNFTTEDEKNKIYPRYEKFSSVRSSLNLTYGYLPSTWSGSSYYLWTTYTELYAVFDYDPTQYDVQLLVYALNSNNQQILNHTVHYIHSFWFDHENNVLKIRYYQVSGSTVSIQYANYAVHHAVDVYCPGGVVGMNSYFAYRTSGSSQYVDISSGYYINMFNTHQNSGNLDNFTKLSLPSYPRDLLMTMDFNTITASSYEFELINKQTLNDNILYFVKTTDGSGVHWRVYRDALHNDLAADLFYDSSRSSNTYQIFLNRDGGEFRYIGDWPTLIGEANYYLKYEFDWLYTAEANNLGSVLFGGQMTPLMRIDAASYRAFEYQIIEDQLYTPSIFKGNPATTISNPILYGSSLTFGGNTYTVTDGKINISGHDVPVKDLVLSSIPNDAGTFDNRIGNTVISTSASPSTITFNGKWSASISTQSMESYTYTKTQWNAGSFGWDGVDQNFLMVGLLTCLGVFIALGIYARKRGTGGLIPLMIVTGCAAAVFFIML